MRLDRAGYLLVALLFGLIYARTFTNLSESWAANDTYSYGYLVPFISGYLVWLRWDVLQRLPKAPSIIPGSVLLFIGLTLLAVGRVSSTNLLEGISLIVTLIGVVQVLFGTRILRGLAFPIAYLLTMIPFWDFLTARLQLPFQLYSATVGVSAVRLLGIPVLREGVLIELPDLTLEVANVCSGVNNLVALLCVGLPMTYISIKGWLKRGFIIASAVTIALLSNGLRVAMISVFAYYGIRGADGDVHGPYSLLRTMAITAVGFLVLFWLISQFADKPKDGKAFALAWPIVPLPGKSGRRRSLAVAVLAFAIFFGFDWWREATPVPLRVSLVALPTNIDGWQSRSLPSFESDLGRVQFDHRLSRNYVSADGAELNLFVGYFETQEQGREVVGAQIRSILSRAQSAVDSPSLGAEAHAKDFVMTSRGHTFYVTYWYTLNGSVAAGDYEAKLYMAWNALARRTTNGTITVVKAQVPDGQTIEQSRKRVQGFIQSVMAVSKEYLPRR